MPPASDKPSCWTCRLRKKKCDRRRPVCTTCSALGIQCHAGGSRPEWLDGGSLQERKALAVRAEIKQSQDRRRVEKQRRRASPGEGASLTTTTPASTTARSPGGHADPESAAHFDTPTLTDISVDFTVMYLDYVFPFLFPHYQPTIFEGGRAWVLATLQTQKPLYHTAMSLATYFIALLTQGKTVMSATQSSNNDSLPSRPERTLKTVCGRYIWDILEKHMAEAIKAVQSDLLKLSPTSSPSMTPVQQANMLVNIVQLQVFEMSMGSTDSGTTPGVHIKAACNLLNDMLEQHGSLVSIIAALDRPFSEALQGPGWRLWNTDQGAFRFSVAVLLYMDTLSSTTYKQAPLLLKWHTDLIAQLGEDTRDGSKLALEDFVGCEGWVLMTIGEISALVSSQSSSTSRLWKINSYMDRLIKGSEKATAEPVMSPDEVQPQPPPYLQAYYRPETSNTNNAKDKQSIRRIWIHAALMYGETAATVARGDLSASPWYKPADILPALEEAASSPAVLRSLIWPLSIISNGTSRQADRDAIRAIMAKAGPLQRFGGLASTLSYFERLWKLADVYEGFTQDVIDVQENLRTPMFI